MLTRSIKKRLQVYALLFAAVITASLMASVLSIVISGSRASAGLGLLIAPPLVQLAYAIKYTTASILIRIFSAILISITAYLSTLAAIEFVNIKPVIDYYGYFDFLVIYWLFSVLLWEIAHGLISKYQKNRTRKDL